jgi:hypothetical protein
MKTRRKTIRVEQLALKIVKKYLGNSVAFYL